MPEGVFRQHALPHLTPPPKALLLDEGIVKAMHDVLAEDKSQEHEMIVATDLASMLRTEKYLNMAVKLADQMNCPKLVKKLWRMLDEKKDGEVYVLLLRLYLKCRLLCSCTTAVFLRRSQ